MKKIFKILFIVCFSLMSLNIFSQDKTLNNVILKGNLNVEGYSDLGDSIKVAEGEYVDYIPTIDTVKKSAIDTAETHTFNSLSSDVYNVGNATIDNSGEDIVLSKNLWFTVVNDSAGYKSGSTRYSFFSFGQNQFIVGFSTSKKYEFDDDAIIGVSGAGPTYSFALYNSQTGMTYRPVYNENAGWGRISSNRLAVYSFDVPVVIYHRDTCRIEKITKCMDTIYYEALLPGIPSQPAVIMIDSVSGALYADSTSAASGFGLKDDLINIVEFLRDTVNGELGWKYINPEGDTVVEYNTKGNLWEINQKLFWGVEHAYRYIEEHEDKLNDLDKKIKVLGVYVIILISGLITYIIAKEIR